MAKKQGGWFVDSRTGQSVWAEPCLSSRFGGDCKAYQIHYPEGHKATIQKDVFERNYYAGWPQGAA